MSYSSALADSLVRQQVLDPGQSFHLEAPAGSGKTTQLVARFLTLLAAVNHPGEILVLTFNRQAAGEIKQQVFKLLRGAGSNSPTLSQPDQEPDLAVLAQRAWARQSQQPEWLLTPDSLPIMTFHSFCYQMIRQAPLEAGVEPGIGLVEDEEQDWLRHEAVERMYRRLLDQPAENPIRQALINRLLRLDNNWPRLARELTGLIARRDTLKDFLELARLSQDLNRYQGLMQDRLEFMVGQDLKNLHAVFAATSLGSRWSEFWADLRAAGAKAADTMPAQLPGPGLHDLPGWQTIAATLLTKKGTPRQQWGPASGFFNGFKNTTWAGLIQDLPVEAVDWLQHCRDWSLIAASPSEVAALQDLVLLLNKAIDTYEQLCQERRVLDYVALEQATLRLFAAHDPTDLTLLGDQRLKHILVDEFQDTSQNQHDLLCRIISGWQPGQGYSLFVVGDPKQSIYGWRNAQVRFFVQAQQGLPCPGQSRFPLQPQRLRTNFRSTTTLIAWINDLFARTVMACPNPEVDEVEFHPATSKPEAAPGVPPKLCLFGETTENYQSQQAEARWLANQVKHRLDTLQEKEKIAILLFARTNLHVYLEALHQARVAVKVKEGLKLSDDQIVQHLDNLTRALVRPQDDLAWVALLRAPWGRQDFDCLAAIAPEPGDCWWEKILSHAKSPTCSPDLQNLVGSLEQARQQVGRQPLAVIVTKFLDHWDAWAEIAGRAGASGIANARTYLDLLAQAEMGLPEATLRRAEFLLENAFQPADPQASLSPVEMMTVHAAKGMEFAQVFLPFLDWNPLSRGGREAPPFLLEELPHCRAHALALAKPSGQDRQNALYHRLWKLHQGRIQAEARRLFYVALTRAQEHLFLSGVVKIDDQGRFKKNPNTPLGWLLSHEKLMGEAAAGLPSRLESGLSLEINPMVVESEAEPDVPPTLPEPMGFQPEPLPYQIEFPSSLAAPLARSWEPIEDFPGPDPVNRIRGEIIHRLLATLSQGKDLPGIEAVAAGLRSLGVEEKELPTLAREVLDEVAVACQDPFLAYLLRSAHPRAWTEWRLEDCPRSGLIRRGQIDRLIFDGHHWWLVDYKTARPQPGEDESDFLSREAETYRPQLQAYQEMAAQVLGVTNANDIRLALYFTALRQKICL